MIKATELTDEQKEAFTKAFYEAVSFDDRDSPSPWGCPWHFGFTLELEGSTIEEMVKSYIDANKDDLNEVFEEELDNIVEKLEN